MTGATSLVMEIRPGERIAVGGGLVVFELEKKSGQQARVRVTAPADVPVKKEPHQSSPDVARMTG